MGEGETDREIAALEEKKEKRGRGRGIRSSNGYGRGARVCGTDKQRERERESEKLRRWVVELSIHSATPPRLHVRACARLNLAEVEDFQGKTCIAFYRRIDHLNNSQHGKPRPDSLCVPCAPSAPSPYEFPPFLSLSVPLCPVPNRFLLHPPPSLSLFLL